MLLRRAWACFPALRPLLEDSAAAYAERGLRRVWWPVGLLLRSMGRAGAYEEGRFAFRGRGG
eukprot:7276320-Alexandrium_andersonii.AAC.1